MIKVKPGVRFHLRTFSSPDVTRIVIAVCMTTPSDYHPMITSGCDGKHSVNSKHYTGKALDFRIKDFPADPAVWADRIQKRLGDDYFVLLDKTHVHIQWNG